MTEGEGGEKSSIWRDVIYECPLNANLKLVSTRVVLCFDTYFNCLSSKLNFKFFVTNFHSQVTLTDMECEVCQSIGKSERIERRDICMSTESRKCSTDVEGRWIKMCGKIDNRLQQLNIREPRTDDSTLVD